MKNNYRKLKLKILWQAVFATALTIVVGYILVNVLLEDSSNELVRILTSIHMQEEEARAWYWRVIGNNKEIVMAIGFLALFSAFFYVALAKLEKYLKQIEQGINNIASDSKESIDMIPELQPVETRLREIKQTLKPISFSCFIKATALSVAGFPCSTSVLSISNNSPRMPLLYNSLYGISYADLT